MAPREKHFDKLSAREGYWTPLEKQTRDYIFLPITWPFKFIPYAANMLTLTGFGILFYAVYDFSVFHSYERQIWLLAAAWITDLFDGPIARNNHNVTAFGTAADHIRDYCISFWMLILSFFISNANTELWFVNWILIFTIMGLLGVITQTVMYQKEKRGVTLHKSYIHFLHDFLLNDLVTTVTARIHTVVLAVAGVFYIAGAVWGAVYTGLAVILLLIQLFILGFYIHEIYQAKYEDQAYRIRLALQAEVEKLRVRIQKIRVLRKARKKMFKKF